MEADVALRLGTEQLELGEKIEKLERFIGSDEFKELTEENQFLLKAQVNAMIMYYNILKRRIIINGIRVE